ncbi:hypothetical protein AFLA_004513 [Aspergillus flavus NRRL3357]|nr:hypothetical protein AFLA_004513 [Aspergillus flavus NRRL3357]
MVPVRLRAVLLLVPTPHDCMSPSLGAYPTETRLVLEILSKCPGEVEAQRVLDNLVFLLKLRPAKSNLTKQPMLNHVLQRYNQPILLS